VELLTPHPTPKRNAAFIPLDESQGLSAAQVGKFVLSVLYTKINQTDGFELNKEAKMSKGEETREMILARAAQLFSRQGYFGSSLSDIMHETGLEKGGIYNHFTSKEQLALEAFDYSVELVRRRTRLAFAGKTNAVDRLLAIITVFQELVEDPPLVGGCPILKYSG